VSRVTRWGTSAIAALLAACTPTINANRGTPAGGASQVVDATGGTVTTDEGTTLVIPPNALSSQVTITIALDPSPVPITQATAVTAAHVFGPAGITFNEPVCITLAFEPELLPQGVTENDVVLYAAPPGSGNYQPLTTTAVDATHVMGTTNQFATTVFAAYGGATEIPADAAGAPNCDAGDGGDAGDAGTE
jgi:hypothetical protein